MYDPETTHSYLDSHLLGAVITEEKTSSLEAD